jgi:protein SCO1/2
MSRIPTVLLSLAVLAAGPFARADDPSLPLSLRGVGFDQHLDQQVPLELNFKDEAGNDVQFGNYFQHARPVILVLAYFRCPMLCTEVLNGLVRALLDVDLRIGSDFDVVTVSFDPRETPAMATAIKKSYLDRYGKPAAKTSWHFLTGNQTDIDRLTRAVGFRYRYDAKNDQFAHASGIMILTPEGKISRYFFDVHFSPRDLRLGLVEASANRIGSPVDQILLYCFHYDPLEGKYGPTIMNFIRLGGVLTILSLAALISFLWQGERRRARVATTTAK